MWKLVTPCERLSLFATAEADPFPDLNILHERAAVPSPPVRRLRIRALVLVLLSSCALGSNDDEPDAASLVPQFAPSESTLPPSNTSSPPAPTPESASNAAPATRRNGRPGSSAATVPTGTSSGGGSTATTAAATPPAAPSEPITPTTGTISDRQGDVTFSLDRRPDWADLIGGTLTRRGDGYELRVKLGGAVPSTYETERTINIASFYDVTGDGSIDYEVWVNLAAEGWGGSYFDNTRTGANRINDEALTITPTGDELVVSFPLAHLAAAERMQWALAMEWGRYEAIGTAAAARDDAPDNDAAAAFPSG